MAVTSAWIVLAPQATLAGEPSKMADPVTPTNPESVAA